MIKQIFYTKKSLLEVSESEIRIARLNTVLGYGRLRFRVDGVELIKRALNKKTHEIKSIPID